MLIRPVLLILCVIVGLSHSVTAAEIDRAALQAMVNSDAQRYQEAFKKRDAEELAKLFTPEAEYVDSSGVIFHGRGAIQAEYAANFQLTPPGELIIGILSIRPVAPGIVVEDGVSTFRPTDEAVADVEVRYTAIHVQQADGSWLLASIRELNEPVISAHDRLKTLSWLLGVWREEVGNNSVTTEWKWAENGNYLISNFTIQGKNGELLNGTQRIGWDAERNQFRSWVFESTGGTADGWWTANPDGTWSVQLNGINVEGARISGLLTYAPDGADGLIITREMQSRNGVAQPSFVHRVVRQPPAPVHKVAR